MPWIEPMFEESPVTEHAANGHVEGAIKRIAGQVRCIKDATEHKYKTQFHARDMILSWMIQHAAFLLNRYGVGKDGRTPFELAHGKPYRRVMLPFGECCQFMAVKGSGARQTKLDVRWQRGVFVGILPRSDEAIVATPDGIRKARSIRREPESTRYDLQFLNQTRGLLWELNPDGGSEGVLPAGVSAEVNTDIPVAPPVTKTEQAHGAKRVYIRAAVELRKYGYTPHCPACVVAQSGKKLIPPPQHRKVPQAD